MSASPPELPVFDWIDEATVKTLAHCAGYEFGIAELPAIAAQLRRACDIAAPLLACDLPDDEEPGPVWRP